MKIRIFLILVIFLIACTAQQPQEENEPNKEIIQENVIEVTPPDFYQLKLQQTEYFEGIPITLTDLKPSSAVIKIYKTQRTFDETQKTALIDNLEITILEFYYSGSNFAANKVIVTINPLELSSKQYVVYANEELNVKNNQLKLLDVYTDNSIFVSVGETTKKIKLNSTETIENLNVKNVKSYHSDSPVDKAAVLEIK